MVKSYLKKSSKLKVCANSSSVTQAVIGVPLQATCTNASNNRAASNTRRLSSGVLQWLSDVGFCTESDVLQFPGVTEQGR